MSNLSFSYDECYVDAYPGDTVERYRNYLADKAKIEYGAGLISDAIRSQTNTLATSINDAADCVGQTINDAADHIGQTINDAADHIGQTIEQSTGQIVSSIQTAANAICQGLGDVHEELSVLNRRAAIVVEQQKVTNMLLANIVDLLKLPDSEKERWQSINMGLKLFQNAAKSPELYDDALEEFLKAESLRKQDPFVLYRIASIYLYVERCLDPTKAQAYFSRAAKYATIGTDPEYAKLAKLMVSPANSGVFLGTDNDSIRTFSSDSYDNAAFASYVIEDLDSAVKYQQKAYELDPTPEHTYNLAKYYSHKSCFEESKKYLEEAISKEPKFAAAVFQEADMVSKPEIVSFLTKKNDEVNAKLSDVINIIDDPGVKAQLADSMKSESYPARCRLLKRANKLLL